MMETLRQILAACLAMTVVCLIGPDVRSQSSLVNSQSLQPHPVNLDFEQGTLGQAPDGWVGPNTANYGAELTAEQPKSGKYAVLLHSNDAPASGSSFGNLMQAIDATPYRGRRVRFRASVRVGSGRAGLWMRVDRAANKAGFFDNMGSRPITSVEWHEYDIVGDVDEDATVLNIGMILPGKGKAWLDAVSVEDLGKLVVRSEPPRPLSGRGLENLIAFTRLLGYVRHFHPSDEANATAWDAFAVDGMLAVESARNADELAERLSTIFHPIGPTVRVFPTGKGVPPAEPAPAANTPGLEIVSWKHRGFGPGTPANATYHSERVRTAVVNTGAVQSSPDSNKPFTADLGGGVSCIVPLALFADANGTLPHAAQRPQTRNTLIKYSGNDRATRLADVALSWNMLEHFYPYFDVVKTDWPRALKDALTSAATDENENAFTNTLKRMVAQLHDGHGNVFHPGEPGGFTVPVIFGWVEGRLVITEVAAAGGGGLLPGDIVLRVDGRPSTEALAEREALISGATPQWRRYGALITLADGGKDSELALEVQGEDGQTRAVVLHRTMENLNETRPPKISELKPGIVYVALDRIKDEDFQAALPQLEKASGIIFDLRGYPSVSRMVISHLIDAPVTSARWMVPIITTPDHINIVNYDTGGRWDLKPIAPRLKAKLAFLTDGRAISYAESYMGIIEAYKLAEIVGEPTAGTNGNINPITFPGNYTIVW
ncbi:MAG TPA: S41 family peptidase, partial [Pyrinomonadaceae bacterium]|nr:S41 family peptidase [Pyrinomonadaceae bacterium]